MALAGGGVVPSLGHELIVELLRTDQELLRALLPLELPGFRKRWRAREASAEFTQLVPSEYRADYVGVFHDAAQRPRLAVVIEVQRRRDARKLGTWPVYVVAARQRYRCPAVLVVIALDAAVASWARRPIGDLGFTLHQIVISAAEVSAVRPSSRWSLGVAVLCALSSRTAASASVAISAITRSGSSSKRLYLDAVLCALPTAERSALEDLMPYEEVRTKWLRDALLEGWRAGKKAGLQAGKKAGLQAGKKAGLQAGKKAGLKVGKKAGLKVGKQRGRTDGVIRGLQAAVLRFARARLGGVAAEDAARVRVLRDERELSALISQLGSASSSDQVRALLRRLPKR